MSQSNPPEHLCSNNTKSRTYLFTINNFTEEEEEKFKTYDCEYSIYQIEIGKKNQIIHIQGTLHFKNPRSFNKLKKDFPRAHIKAIKWGSDEAVFNYCGKSDTR
ncbi:hypothetical protein, partial [Campylobacter coli]|uniref:hypothetical protein n=1 Tax=Campylobacter coli TaxID=195 RepID=UPI003F7C0733